MCEDTDLKEMGLPLGPRKKLLSHLQELRQRQVLLCVRTLLPELLRSSTSKLLEVPCTNLHFGSMSFRVSAPTLWNSLPHSVRFCDSLITFRKYLNFLFSCGILWCPLATHYPSTTDSICNFWRFINLFTYLLTYLYEPAISYCSYTVVVGVWNVILMGSFWLLDFSVRWV